MNALKYECGYFSEGYCTIFFYIVYFMYLLYILCIGSCDCYWNNAEEMMCVISTDLLAILEQTWKKKNSWLPPARWKHTNARMRLCRWCVVLIGHKQTEECRRKPFFKESRISSSYYTRYEECITLFGLTLVACDNVVIFKTTCMCFFFFSFFFLPVLEVCGCNWELLSELGAVGSLCFHSTLTTARY